MRRRGGEARRFTLWAWHHITPTCAGTFGCHRKRRPISWRTVLSVKGWRANGKIFQEKKCACYFKNPFSPFPDKPLLFTSLSFSVFSSPNARPSVSFFLFPPPPSPVSPASLSLLPPQIDRQRKFYVFIPPSPSGRLLLPGGPGQPDLSPGSDEHPTSIIEIGRGDHEDASRVDVLWRRGGIGQAKDRI